MSRRRPADVEPAEIVACCYGSTVVLEVHFQGTMLEVFLDDPREFARDVFQAADIAETRAEYEP